MIEAFKKIWQFAGTERANINKSVAVSFLNAMFHMLEVGAIYFVVLALVDGEQSMRPIWISSSLMVVSIIGSGATDSMSRMRQTHAGYFMAANRRVAIGDRLKGVPMGYFNENNLGEVTGVMLSNLIVSAVGAKEYQPLFSSQIRII